MTISTYLCAFGDNVGEEVTGEGEVITSLFHLKTEQRPRLHLRRLVKWVHLVSANMFWRYMISDIGSIKGLLVCKPYAETLVKNVLQITCPFLSPWAFHIYFN